MLSPAYEKDGEHNPGYIAAYPAGIRENGGQYTHAAVWTAMGCAEAEMPEICADILKTINPPPFVRKPPERSDIAVNLIFSPET